MKRIKILECLIISLFISSLAGCYRKVEKTIIQDAPRKEIVMEKPYQESVTTETQVVDPYGRTIEKKETRREKRTTYIP